MPMIFIKCPETGKLVATGFNVPKPIDSNTFINNKVRCPHCGQVHVWSNHDAIFEDGTR